MKFSVIIATYNRADYLRDSLESLAGQATIHDWEVIVVDNNSTDNTRSVVEDAGRRFPVEIKYLFEPQQGKSAALNTAIRAARGDILALTDDDVQIEPDWLDQAAEALDRHQCDYVGGKVLPIWGAPPPNWFPNRGWQHLAVIALLDYGPDPIELVNRSPLGVNMAIRRTAFTRLNLWWDNRVDRQGNSLRGQGQREWCMRARKAGLKGFYIPGMIVHHIVPQDRLNKQYFRRWMFWNGISRAILYEMSGADMEGHEQTVPGASMERQIGGVPRYIFRRLASCGVRFMKACVRRDRVAMFEQDMHLWFYAGIIKQRWKDRKNRARVELRTKSVAGNN
jgi:glycosyltransferase involved in cell wall biosynthesis